MDQGNCYERIDQIERQLNAYPDAFPVFAAAAGKLDEAMDETDAHPDAKLTERDDLWIGLYPKICVNKQAGAKMK